MDRFCKYCDRHGGVGGDGWCPLLQKVTKDLETCDWFKEPNELTYPQRMD